MIAHVAQVAESRGCVVFCSNAGPAASPVALEAATQVARAFDSRIEGLVIRDQRLIDYAAHENANRMSLRGEGATDVTVAGIAQDVHFSYLALRRLLLEAGEEADVPASLRVVQGEPVEVLANVCAASGPWNVIVLAEPFNAHSGRAIEAILAQAVDATGVVVVGPNAVETSAMSAGSFACLPLGQSASPSLGRVAVLVEDADRMPAMSRAARILAASLGCGIDLLIAAQAREDQEWLEGEARRFVAGFSARTMECVALGTGEPVEIAECLRQRAPRIVLSRFAGLAVPTNDLGPLATALGCPLFLVR